MSNIRPTREGMPNVASVDLLEFLSNAPAVAELSKKLEEELTELQGKAKVARGEVELAAKDLCIREVAVKRMKALIAALNAYLMENDDDGGEPL